MRHTLHQLVGKQVCGQCETIIMPHTRQAILSSIHIHKPHRASGFGSCLLHHAERHLMVEHDVNVVNTLVWQPQADSTHLFYEKNGYNPMPTEREQYYDNGDCVYELLPYIKVLSHRINNNKNSIPVAIAVAEDRPIDIQTTCYQL